ncbi:MAG TPA: hypothetical protein VK578_03000 [Edaphobacter sp.]|nr:hypothetical protein [Edaphobacter sp.]
MESIAADIRFALRQIRRSPGFSVAVILLLALGIGATTAVFSLVDAILLEPVPYPEPNSVVLPWNIPPAGSALAVSTSFHGARFTSMRSSRRRRLFGG